MTMNDRLKRHAALIDDMARARGIDLQAIYLSHYMGESQGIYVRPSSSKNNYTGIQTPFDLKGRTLGVPFGSTMHYQVLFLVDLLGLSGSVCSGLF